jgi:hypothetical protein
MREFGIMTDEEVWVRAWVAVAASVGGKLSDCERYADACLAQYRDRQRNGIFDVQQESSSQQTKAIAKKQDAIARATATSEMSLMGGEGPAR